MADRAVANGEWVVARAVHYAHEAHRLRARLSDSGIDVHLPDDATLSATGALSVPGGVRIMVRAHDRDRAVAILDEPLREMAVSSVADIPGPVGVYSELSKHQYDPGHYLGGTIEPHLRSAELGPKARGLAAALLVLNAVVGITVMAVSSGPRSWSDAVPIAFLLLVFAAGWRMATRR